MKPVEPTDEELLTYLIGDGEPSQCLQIENWLSADERNHLRLNFLRLLRLEIQNSPFVFSRRSASQLWFLYVSRLGFLISAMLVGMWIQAHWKPLNSQERTPLHLSQPLSFETLSSNDFL